MTVVKKSAILPMQQINLINYISQYWHIPYTTFSTYRKMAVYAING